MAVPAARDPGVPPVPGQYVPGVHCVHPNAPGVHCVHPNVPGVHCVQNDRARSSGPGAALRAFQPLRLQPRPHRSRPVGLLVAIDAPRLAFRRFHWRDQARAHCRGFHSFRPARRPVRAFSCAYGAKPCADTCALVHAGPPSGWWEYAPAPDLHGPLLPLPHPRRLQLLPKFPRPRPDWRRQMFPHPFPHCLLRQFPAAVRASLHFRRLPARRVPEAIQLPERPRRQEPALLPLLPPAVPRRLPLLTRPVLTPPDEPGHLLRLQASQQTPPPAVR